VQMLQRVVKVRGRKLLLARVTWPGPPIREAARGVSGGVVGGEESIGARWSGRGEEGWEVAGRGAGGGVWSFPTCVMGRSACVQCRPWLTQSLQYPHSPSLQ
jgi:hypothetical protein